MSAKYLEMFENKAEESGENLLDCVYFSQNYFKNYFQYLC